MFRSEVEKSTPSLHPSLDLFSTSPTIAGVETIRYTEVSLTSGCEIRPMEFRIQNAKCFLDLQRSYIITRYKIVDEDGQDIAAAPNYATDAYAPVNLFGLALFRELQLFINGVLCYDANYYPYRSYMSAMLSFSKEYKNTFLRICGYSPENSTTSATDEEYLKRAKACAKSAVQEVVSPIWIEPATSGKPILPFVDLKLLAFPSPDEFLIDRRAGTNKYKVKILSMSLMLREIHAHDSTLMAFDQMLKTRGSLTYSSLSSNTRTVWIPGGIKEFPCFKIFTNNVPRRIFCGLVDAASFNGNYSNPFVFKPYGLQSIRVEAAGETVPFADFNLDYNKSLYSRAFLALSEALSVAGSGNSNGITPAAFASHMCVYAFDLSGGAESSDSFVLQRVGETTVKLSFSTDTPSSGLYLIVIGESVSNLVVDSERNITMY